MAKEVYYKGINVDELKEKPVEEIIDLLPARARRSLKRRNYQPSIDPRLNKKITKAIEDLKNGKKPKPIKTHRRDTVIIPQMIGLTFLVHNGKEFVRLEIEPYMVGHYFGEYVLTRKRVLHGKAGIGATRSSLAVARR